MPPSVPVVGQPYIFYVCFDSQANPRVFQDAPTLAAEDFTVSINGGPEGPLDNLPTNTPAGSKRVQFVISAAENTTAGIGGKTSIVCSDAVGNQWCDLHIELTVFACDLPTAAEIADAVHDEALADHEIPGSAGAKLSSLCCTLGAGAITFIYTLTSDVDGSPIPNADVWVTTDAAGLNVVAAGTTDMAGQVTFYLDAGNYYVFRQRDGFTFDNPDTEVVA
jgi:hypothetical protein